MKKTLLFFWTLLPLMVFSQAIPFNEETGKVEYTDVIQVKGSKDELFSRAKKWTASAFKSAQNVIQAEDKEEGYLVIKGLFDANTYVIFNKIPVSQNGVMDFTIALDFKESRYRYRIFDISFRPIGALVEMSTPIEAVLINEEEEAITIREESIKLKVPKKYIEETIKVRFSMYDQYRKTATSTIEGLIKSLKSDMNVGSEMDDW